ncbi:MAG: aldolase, partial [Acidimicrobiales bacterium]
MAELTTHISNERWLDLLETRALRPEATSNAFASRTRRPLLKDGRLLIVAADHTSRGVLGVRDKPLAMANRRSLLER